MDDCFSHSLQAQGIHCRPLNSDGSPGLRPKYAAAASPRNAGLTTQAPGPLLWYASAVGEERGKGIGGGAKGRKHSLVPLPAVWQGAYGPILRLRGAAAVASAERGGATGIVPIVELRSGVAGGGRPAVRSRRSCPGGAGREEVGGAIGAEGGAVGRCAVGQKGGPAGRAAGGSRGGTKEGSTRNGGRRLNSCPLGIALGAHQTTHPSTGGGCAALCPLRALKFRFNWQQPVIWPGKTPLPDPKKSYRPVSSMTALCSSAIFDVL